MTNHKLPELPDGLEWVVNAEAERFTVTLSYCVPENADREARAAGYIAHHTHRHPAVMTQAQWEGDVINAAKHLWTNYTEGNKHAQWADEIMRRSR